jgi:hypothetical protein
VVQRLAIAAKNLCYQWENLIGPGQLLDEKKATMCVFNPLDAMLNGSNILDPDIWGMPINAL